MNITRHNYEEYFLLYVDNELTVEERKAVDAFIQKNPDLEEELVMIMQSTIRPDNAIVFPDKDALLKNIPAGGLINETNWEEYFVLYADNELTNKEKDLVEQFVYRHPQYQSDFELIQQVKLVPDNHIVYPNKQELYRTEEDNNKVVPFRWYRMAAAAVILLFMSTLGWYFSNRDGENTINPPSRQVAVNEKPDTRKTPPVTGSGEKEITPAGTPEKTTTDIAKQPAKPVTGITPADKHVVLAAADPQKKSVQAGNISVTPNVPPETDKMSALVHTSIESDLKAKRVATGMIEEQMLPPATVLAVNEVTPETIMESTAATQDSYTGDVFDNDLYIANASLNKNPLRGLFRKVTRVFDKATNIEPAENNKAKGIRIASFEIALK